MLRIDFLNVGDGDCTVIRHSSGRLTVVDMNNGSDLDPNTASELSELYGLSWTERAVARATGLTLPFLEEKGYDIRLTNPVQFLRETYPDQPVFRYIQTHPDLDHMRGLVAIRNSGIPILNFWDRNHDKEPDFQSDSDREEWSEYLKLQAGARGNRVLRLFRENAGIYWNEEPAGVPGGDGIHILSPTPDLEAAANESGNTNSLSYVLLVVYKGTRVILGGDAEAEVWDSIVAHYGADLKCHVLKASHHGRDSGYHPEALKEMSPEYTIVSVGKKPETDATNKYRYYSQNVLSTRWKGNITLIVDDQGKRTITSQYDR